jgi:uncharacterized metal-binding protein
MNAQGSGGTDLMFCCSGAADTAEIGDRGVRTLHKAGEARMFCLAGIAGKVESIETNTRAAGRLLIVDGCDSDCARKTMELAGFAGFTHVRVTDLGWEKGNAPATDERVAALAERLRQLLGAGPAVA